MCICVVDIPIYNLQFTHSVNTFHFSTFYLSCEGWVEVLKWYILIQLVYVSDSLCPSSKHNFHIHQIIPRMILFQKYHKRVWGTTTILDFIFVFDLYFCYAFNPVLPEWFYFRSASQDRSKVLLKSKWLEWEWAERRTKIKSTQFPGKARRGGAVSWGDRGRSAFDHRGGFIGTIGEINGIPTFF